PFGQYHRPRHLCLVAPDIGLSLNILWDTLERAYSVYAYQTHGTPTGTLCEWVTGATAGPICRYRETPEVVIMAVRASAHDLDVISRATKHIESTQIPRTHKVI